MNITFKLPLREGLAVMCTIFTILTLFMNMMTITKLWIRRKKSPANMSQHYNQFKSIEIRLFILSLVIFTCQTFEACVWVSHVYELQLNQRQVNLIWLNLTLSDPIPKKFSDVFGTERFQSNWRLFQQNFYQIYCWLWSSAHFYRSGMLNYAMGFISCEQKIKTEVEKLF